MPEGPQISAENVAAPWLPRIAAATSCVRWGPRVPQ